MKTVNIKEFKTLIIRYETITLEEIKIAFAKKTALEIMKRNLTGFGSKSHCTLCQKIGWEPGESLDCSKCVYYQIVFDTDFYPCNSNENKETYNEIDCAGRPESLIVAYHNRARYMRTILDKLKIKQP